MKKIYLFVAICFLTNINAFAQVPCQTTLTSAIGTDAQSICDGIAMTDITYQVSGTNATAAGLPSGVSGSFAAGIFTISGTPAVDGTFNYTVTTTGGCSPDTSATGSITVYPLPALSSSLSLAICSGSTASYTPTSSSAGASFTWSRSTMSGISEAGTSGTGGLNEILTNTTTSNISVIYLYTTSANGCSNAGENVVVDVNPIPSVTVNSATICAGTSATLTAAGATNYFWSNGSTGATLTASPVSTSSYIITGTTMGCSSSAVGTITVNALPVVTVNSPTICGGQSTILNANGAITYLWSDGSTANPLTTSPSATTSYTVIGTSLGCSGQAVATVTVIQTPVITVNSPAICQGSSATLTANGGNAYFWSPGGFNTASINVTPTTTTSYTVAGTTTGCSGHAVGTVTIAHEPVLMPGGTDLQTICINNPILEIPYDVFLSYTVTGLPPGVSFQYNIGNHSLKISGTPTVAGVYTYTLVPQSSACNLSTTRTGTITVKPLSNSSTNPGGCDGFINISGNVYRDNNSNCTKDGGDQGIDNIHLKLYNANNTLLAHKYTSSGAYDFTIWDSAGIYTVELDVDGQALSTQCPSPGLTSTVTITSANPQVSNVDFNLQCNADYGIQSIFRTGLVFPGQQHQLHVCAGELNDWYNLNCPATGSGTLQITVNGPVTYNYSAPGALSPTVQGNTFTYTINNWSTVNMQQDFRLMFTTHTTAQANDTICVSVVLTTLVNDINTGNNTNHFCYAVRNSYDPNLKEVYPVDVEPGFADWLTYTIHFQNTGNAPAINIRLKDTLDAQLNLETFQVLNYSHANIISIYDHLLTVYYPNIQLPDSLSDPTGSQGFVQYRLKPKANLILGTQIKNTANIYFDYNAPIRTNTTVNECKAAITSIIENKQNSLLSVYPNPNNGAFTVKSTNEGVYSIINELGQILQQFKLSSTNQYTVNIENLNNGVYFIVGDSIQQKIVVIK